MAVPAIHHDLMLHLPAIRISHDPVDRVTDTSVCVGETAGAGGHG